MNLNLSIHNKGNMSGSFVVENEIIDPGITNPVERCN